MRLGVHEDVRRRAGLHEGLQHMADMGRFDARVQLAVGKGPGPAEAAHGVADLAVNTFPHLARHNGAAAVVDVLALIHDQHLHPRIAADELVAGKYPGLSAAQNHGIVGFPHGISFLF